MVSSKQSIAARDAAMKNATSSGHAEAFRRWFEQFERERKARRIAPGRRVPGFPDPPAAPDDVSRVVAQIGEAAALELCGVHRTTLARWLSGAVQIPRADWCVLRFAADGVPPGCGEAWRGFQWLADAVICPDGKTRVTAREIEGLHYQRAAIDAQARRIAQLEAMVIDLARQIGTAGAANDGYTHPGDVRSRAFTATAAR
jgi:hypothetical protein